jgi:putative tryptophan/tyrosine transport system permease protein
VSLSGVKNPLIYNVIARHPELPLLLVIGLCIIAMLIFLCRTQLCYAWAVFGSSPHFFRHYGISAHYVFVVGLCVSNALAGLTGYLFAQSTGFADINMGVSKTLFCITALMLGKTVCNTKKPIMPLIPIIGCILYFVMQQLLLKVGFNLKYFTAVQALLVLIILIVHARRAGNTIDHLGV